MSMPRIPLPSPEEMDADQRAVFERIVNGPRGKLVGPLRAALHNPVLADRWQALGQVLRFDTSLPPALSELAILVVARRWNSELEWTIHARDGRRAGLADTVIEDIKTGTQPRFTSDAEAEVYEFSRQLLETGKVDDTAYAAILARWDVVGAVELTALVGYYSMVAMTLNAHGIPLPEDMVAELNPTQATLSAMPPLLREAAE